MLAVHAFWSRSRGLCLWAEDAGRTVKSPSQALRTARPHPFAASSDALSEIHPGKPATATLLLPSLRSGPLDSPELVRITPRPAPTTAPMLLPWSVPVVWFDPAASLAVLGERADGVATAPRFSFSPRWRRSRGSSWSGAECCRRSPAPSKARSLGGGWSCRDRT